MLNESPPATAAHSNQVTTVGCVFICAADPLQYDVLSPAKLITLAALFRPSCVFMAVRL